MLHALGRGRFGGGVVKRSQAVVVEAVVALGGSRGACGGGLVTIRRGISMR